MVRDLHKKKINEITESDNDPLDLLIEKLLCKNEELTPYNVLVLLLHSNKQSSKGTRLLLEKDEELQDKLEELSIKISDLSKEMKNFSIENKEFVDNFTEEQKEYFNKKLSALFVNAGLKSDGTEHGPIDRVFLKIKSIFLHELGFLFAGAVIYHIIRLLITRVGGH